MGFHRRESSINLHTMPSTRKRQGVCHCQVQPIKARPRVFTLDIETWYSISTTKNEVTKCHRPHLPRTLLQSAKRQAHNRHTHSFGMDFPRKLNCICMIVKYSLLLINCFIRDNCSCTRDRPCLDNTVIISSFPASAIT